jgi:GH15 family glucan-1,4-alpha-glucosidase
VQYYGSKDVDAALLLIPLVGFLPCDDPRVAGTVTAIKQELMVDGLVQRYRSREHVDGLPPGEGVFLACSFWLADVLILSGQVGEARGIFERLLALRNDVGLLAEEYDPRTGRALGNFPQAFSHVGLINTAHNLSLARGPAEQRADTRATRAAKGGRLGEAAAAKRLATARAASAKKAARTRARRNTKRGAERRGRS